MIEHGLEARAISSNHYLSNLMGLVVLGLIFPEDRQARRWLAFAGEEFPRALLAQTHEDGGLNEASLRYHAFVTEMALTSTLAAPGIFAGEARRRLESMCQAVADFADATGDVFAVGDDDSGRVLALDHFCDCGRARVLISLAEKLLERRITAQPAALYPRSGWWSVRNESFHVCAEFGGVGLLGMGSHAHNDDLSFCLDWKGQSVLVDPGTGIYTGDRKTRDAFRASASHNVLMIDGAEQRPIGTNAFRMDGSAEPWEGKVESAGRAVFKRTLTRGVAHERWVTLEPGGLVITDKISGCGEHQLNWRFHLHPSVEARATGAKAELQVTRIGQLLLENNLGLPIQIREGSYSQGYGRIEAARVCTVEAKVNLPYEIRWCLGLPLA
jgi:hypothetical protein